MSQPLVRCIQGCFSHRAGDERIGSPPPLVSPVTVPLRGPVPPPLPRCGGDPIRSSTHQRALRPTPSASAGASRYGALRSEVKGEDRACRARSGGHEQRRAPYRLAPVPADTSAAGSLCQRLAAILSAHPRPDRRPQHAPPCGRITARQCGAGRARSRPVPADVARADSAMRVAVDALRRPGVTDRGGCRCRTSL